MKRLDTDIDDRLAMLGSSPVFEALPSDVARSLAGLCLARRYDRGETIFSAGQSASGFFVVVDGLVKVSRLSPEAREQVLHLFGPGQMVGEVPVFEGGAYPADAEAVTSTGVLMVPRHDFLTLCRDRPEVMLSMCAVLARRLRRFVDLVDDLSLKDVTARLARYLLQQADGDTLTLPITKSLLARQLGTIAETLSRTFTTLQSDGVIDVDGKTITLLDRHRLEELARGWE